MTTTRRREDVGGRRLRDSVPRTFARDGFFERPQRGEALHGVVAVPEQRVHRGVDLGEELHRGDARTDDDAARTRSRVFRVQVLFVES
jgi:hypothetical protein